MTVLEINCFIAICCSQKSSDFDDILCAETTQTSKF